MGQRVDHLTPAQVARVRHHLLHVRDALNKLGIMIEEDRVNLLSAADNQALATARQKIRRIVDGRSLPTMDEVSLNCIMKAVMRKRGVTE